MIVCLDYHPSFYDTEEYMSISLETFCWKYGTHVTLVVKDNFLLVILTVPTDECVQSSQVTGFVSRVCCATIMYFRIFICYRRKYLSISRHGLCTALLREHELRIFMPRKNSLCMLNPPLCPVETLEWCVYVLFHSVKKEITDSFWLIPYYNVLTSC